MKPSLYLVVFFSCVLVCTAQEIINPPKPAGLLSRFRFKMYNGGVMLVRAKLGCISDSLNFILDTGSGGISLDSTTCARHFVTTTASDTLLNGMGGVHKVRYLFNQRLLLPQLNIEKLDFHINDYSILTSVYGEKIDGIIGYSFFRRFIVQIDFDSTTISIYKPGVWQYPKGGTLLTPAINRIPVHQAVVRDRKKIPFNFYFDTGAGLSFLMSEAFAGDSNVLRKKRRPVYMQAEGMGGKLRMQLTVVKYIKIGRYRFNRVPTYIFDDGSNVTAYPHGGGLIGNDLLRRFNLTVNYPAGEIHLLPNSHFGDPFDYAYTGLSIYFEEGVIYIDDVIPGSPGQKAGLRQGDVLLGVNTNFTNNIMQYKALLQAAEEKIKIFIRRGGELMTMVIRPVNIK